MGSRKKSVSASSTTSKSTKKVPAKKGSKSTAKKVTAKKAPGSRPTKKATTKKASSAASKKSRVKKKSAKEAPPAVKRVANPQAEALLEEVLRIAEQLPEAWRDSPWGDVAIKVRKKAFIFAGESKTGAFGLSVKLPESGQVVLEMPIAVPTGYGLGKSGWVSLTLADVDLPPAAMLNAFVVESYRAIAPKTLVKQLSPAR